MLSIIIKNSHLQFRAFALVFINKRSRYKERATFLTTNKDSMAQQTKTCTVIGYIGDPIYTETETHTRLQFGVAVNFESRPDNDGVVFKHTDWTSCELTGARAKAIKPFLSKGSYVSVTGDLRWFEFKKKDADKAETLESLRVQQIVFLDKKPTTGEAAADGT